MDSSQYVRVAVNIRPLMCSELSIGCTDCITVVPGEPQVQIGSHSFTYDHVHGSTGLPSSAIFNDCVAPPVDALFRAYNATVLAYGQSGSGKTYTMGTDCNGEESIGGIIPEVMDTIFKRIEAIRDSTEFLVRVSFFEAALRVAGQTHVGKIEEVAAFQIEAEIARDEATSTWEKLHEVQTITQRTVLTQEEMIFKEEVFDLLDQNSSTSR